MRSPPIATQGLGADLAVPPFCCRGGVDLRGVFRSTRHAEACGAGSDIIRDFNNLQR